MLKLKIMIDERIELEYVLYNSSKNMSHGGARPFSKNFFL